MILRAWQELLVSRHPDEFLAGLIHSDGCRCINRVNGYAYPRYFFSNSSGDIRGLYKMACALVGVEWRESGPYVSVARRRSVEILDRLVGPKR